MGIASRGALLREIGAAWAVDEFTVDSPGVGEVMVDWQAAGLCHSDEHVRLGHRISSPEVLPMLCGHEGAGVVTAVGSGVTAFQEGDHVASSAIASCGRCENCADGRQYLCLNAQPKASIGQLSDGAIRHHCGDRPLALQAKLGTFSERSVVSDRSVIKIDEAIPFAAAAVVSCGVQTGWGAAVRTAETQPGDVVVVVGTGGLGISAIQGAQACGASAIVAVDLSQKRLDMARQFGATSAVTDLSDAAEIAFQLTKGRGAQRVILTVAGNGGDLLAAALKLTAKAGIVVLAGLGRYGPVPLELDLYDLSISSKQIRGCIFGSLNPSAAVPQLLRLYQRGLLQLDEMVTVYPLDSINEAFEETLSGDNIRGVVTMDAKACVT